MKKSQTPCKPTFETVWTALQETDRLQKKYFRKMDESFKKQEEVRAKEQEVRAKEQEARAKEQEARAKEQEVRAKEQEVRAKEQEARAKEQEVRAKAKEEMRIKEQEALDEMRKRSREYDMQFKEHLRQIEQNERRYNQCRKDLDGWAFNHGEFAEEFFINSFADGENNFFGEKFDELLHNRAGVETKEEFDILLINGNSVGIIEIKFKAHKNDIPEVLGKAAAFRLNFPKYKHYKVYLGLASMAFYDELEKECKELGIAIIKQVGESTVIYDENVKAY